MTFRLRRYNCRVIFCVLLAATFFSLTNFGVQNRGELLVTLPKKAPRVFCTIFTHEERHATRATAVRDTWARRCDGHLFVSSADDAALPAVNVTFPDRLFLWKKLTNGMQIVHDRHSNALDFVLKADDDTYVFVDNLRRFLADFDPMETSFFGCKFKVYGGYMSGGAGYVLSKGALEKFIKFYKNETFCRELRSAGGEDIEMGACLRNLNVTFVDTLDEQGYDRFQPLNPLFLLNPTENLTGFWLNDYAEHPLVLGRNCCSEFPISFHFIQPAEMYAIDYLAYAVRHYS